MRKYDYAVVIGRFQPVHKGHEFLINEALKLADNVIILIGSASRAPSIKNPFPYEARHRMIKLAINSNRIVTIPLKDHIYNEQKWIMEVQEDVDSVVFGGETTFVENPRICLVGHAKDNATESYLKLFPQHDYQEITSTGPIDATNVRNMLFSNTYSFEHVASGVLSEPVFRFLVNWKNTDLYKNLKAEYEFLEDFKKSWIYAPYTPTFVTTDAVIIESGHILLIRRGNHPGKGQWALPGGFLDPNEDLITSCIREVHEETGLKVPKKVLRGSIENYRALDHPSRDPRGRFITHAFLFKLAPCPDPKRKFTKVKAADDAILARWIPLNQIHQMQDSFFIDHYDIIMDMIGG